MPKLQVPSSIKASRNAVLEAFLLVVIGILFYFFLLTPKLAEVKSKQAQLDSLDTRRQSLESDVKTLQDLSQHLIQSSADVSRLDQALPLNERGIRTQMLLQQLFSSSAVSVGDISVNETGGGVDAGNLALLENPFAVQRSLNSLTVNVSVGGSFGQLVDLLKKLENYGRIMDVSALSLSAGSNGQLDMKLTFTMYYFAPASAP